MSFDPKGHIRPDFYGAVAEPDNTWHGNTKHEVGTIVFPIMPRHMPRLEVDYAFAVIRAVSGVASIDWKCNYHISHLPRVVVYIYCDTDPDLVDAVCRTAFVNYKGYQCVKI